jgi:tetratricopeptide (TPR) repeat protein
MPLEIQTLGNGAEADLNYLRWPEGLAKCLRAIDLAERTDAVGAEVLARFFASIILWFQGDLARASEQASALLARADQLRDRRWQVSALWIGGTLARYRGDPAVALDMTDRGLALLPADPRLLWTRVSLAHDVGDDATVRSLIAKLLDVVLLTTPEPNLAQASTALVLASVTDTGVAADKLRVAEAAAEAILSFPTATQVVSRVARASLALMAVGRGDAAAAQRHYPALEAARGTFIYESMAGDRLLGLLAALMGEPETAVGHFERALTFCRDGGCAPELAWTCYEFAELLGERSQPGDDDRATALRELALTIARRLGMQPLMGRVLTRR